VPFAIPGLIDQATACLICYERPLMAQSEGPTRTNSTV
jgi:hypothetical protein